MIRFIPMFTETDKGQSSGLKSDSGLNVFFTKYETTRNFSRNAPGISLQQVIPTGAGVTMATGK